MINAFKTLNKRGQHNWTKIVYLAVGLAAGVVLLGKAGFEQSCVTEYLSLVSPDAWFGEDRSRS